MFINRKNELHVLEERASSKKAEFIVIYGRRRIGKSELIDRFLEKQNGIRLLAREESKFLQLKMFSEKLSVFFKDELLNKNPFSNWDSFFEYLAQKSNERIIIAIDEFPYLVKEDPSLPSLLQYYWDTKLKNSKLFIILCGSSMGMMEKLLGYKSPLYGRRTGQLLIRPFSFSDCLEYENNIEKAIEMFSVFGGTPAYLTEFDRKKDIFENIFEKLLKEDSFIYKDVEFVIREELREPRYYFSILLSIARGNTTIGEIMNDIGLDKNIVAKYISILIDLHFIVRSVPITENIGKSKKGNYYLSDNMFSFWFKFIYPYRDIVEKNQQLIILNKFIKPEFNRYVSFIFENICKEFLETINYRNLLPDSFSRFGKQWGKFKGEKGKNTYEIDIMGINENTKEILFCECKWRENMDAKKILEQLKEKAGYVQWNNNDRKEHFAIFAKSFSKKIKEPNLLLFDLKDMEKMIKSGK